MVPFVGPPCSANTTDWVFFVINLFSVSFLLHMH